MSDPAQRLALEQTWAALVADDTVGASETLRPPAALAETDDGSPRSWVSGTHPLPRVGVSDSAGRGVMRNPNHADGGGCAALRRATEPLEMTRPCRRVPARTGARHLHRPHAARATHHTSSADHDLQIVGVLGEGGMGTVYLAE